MIYHIKHRITGFPEYFNILQTSNILKSMESEYHLKSVGHLWRQWWLQFYYAISYHLLDEHRKILVRWYHFWLWVVPCWTCTCWNRVDSVLQKHFYPFNLFLCLVYSSIHFPLSHSHLPRLTLAVTFDGSICFLVTLPHRKQIVKSPCEVCS